jgi:hypothetical protein
MRRFTDSAGRLWVWDKLSDVIFAANPNRIAAETNFYRIQELEDHGHDPLTMEKQFAELEHEVALITAQWMGWLRDCEPEDRIEIPEANREIVALHIALQHLRTADKRDLLKAFAEQRVYKRTLTKEEASELHTYMLWREDSFRSLQKRIQECSWLFARNDTAIPFVTSDNPLLFKTGDNRMWVKVSIFSEGTYAVYPLAPDLIMYCHPREGRWAPIEKFDATLSPVQFTNDMVEHENNGQVFSASRFVLSKTNDFAFARAFAPTIGTDIHASPQPADELSP